MQLQFIYIVATLLIVGVIATVINRFKTVPVNVTTILNVVLALIAVGIGLWLINMYIPMAGIIKAIMNIVVVIATCVGVLQAFSLWRPVMDLWNSRAHHRIIQ